MMALANPRATRLVLRAPPPLPVPWRPARVVTELQCQVIDLIDPVPEMLLGDVVPLAIGAREVLVARSRPECRLKTRRWLWAWCRTPDYLRALAAPNAHRHDRNGAPVEPVNDCWPITVTQRQSLPLGLTGSRPTGS